MDFNYYLPVNLLFGCGKVVLLGKETAKYGKKALLVTGKNSTKTTGLLDKAVDLLRQEGVNVVLFDKVMQNPLSTTAYEGAQLAKSESCDVVVALGGGSIMDCAKAIAFIRKNDGDIFDYIYGIKTGGEALPIIAVPTTCGTGSEGNCFAVLTNPENNDKKSLRSFSNVPKVSIIDPELMTTMPKKILASVGFDALCHNMEAYLSRNAQPMVEIQALYAIELLGKNLVKVFRDYTDMEAWSKVSFASTLGGMVINMAGVTAPHGLEHPASGLRNIVHGQGLAALTPVIYKESIPFAPNKFANISRLLGGTGEGDLVDTLYYLLDAINLRTTLKAQGVLEEDVDWMAQNCIKVSNVSMQAHPKIFTIEEMKDIYYKAL